MKTNADFRVVQKLTGPLFNGQLLSRGWFATKKEAVAVAKTYPNSRVDFYFNGVADETVWTNKKGN